MKKIALLIIILLGIKYTKASTLDSKVESISLSEVFVIEQGFDTNDNIEITFFAQLPNACFKAVRTSVTQEANNFKIDFFIKKKNLSGCETQLTDLDFPINYVQTLSLGEHQAGQYTLSFKQSDKLITKTFTIKEATTNTLDDQLYAPVSSAFIPELINPTNHAKIILTGIFNNSCMHLSHQNIEVIKQGNVFIVLPKANLVKGRFCENEQFPLQAVVDLGVVKKPGNYLIHIRSQSGLSVNRVFHIKDSSSDMRGN